MDLPYPEIPETTEIIEARRRLAQNVKAVRNQLAISVADAVDALDEIYRQLEPYAAETKPNPETQTTRTAEGPQGQAAHSA